jgi:hypothetical protein
MSSALDRLSLVFGRPLPQALAGITSVAWWATFILALLSIWPEAYGQFAIFLSSLGVTITLPASTTIVPVLTVFALLQMTHWFARQRREALLVRDSTAQPKRNSDDGSELSSDLPWLVRKNRHVWLDLIFGVASMAWSIYQSERLRHEAEAKCNAYDALHRVRQDQVVDCPYD